MFAGWTGLVREGSDVPDECSEHVAGITAHLAIQDEHGAGVRDGAEENQLGKMQDAGALAEHGKELCREHQGIHEQAGQNRTPHRCQDIPDEHSRQ